MLRTVDCQCATSDLKVFIIYHFLSHHFYVFSVFIHVLCCIHESVKINVVVESTMIVNLHMSLDPYDLMPCAPLVMHKIPFGIVGEDSLVNNRSFRVHG